MPLPPNLIPVERQQAPRIRLSADRQPNEPRRSRPSLSRGKARKRLRRHERQPNQQPPAQSQLMQRPASRPKQKRKPRQEGAQIQESNQKNKPRKKQEPRQRKRSVPKKKPPRLSSRLIQPSQPANGVISIRSRRPRAMWVRRHQPTGAISTAFLHQRGHQKTAAVCGARCSAKQKPRALPAR